MKVEVFEYLSDYIRNKFPMYYKESNQADFMSFINMIVSDPMFKKAVEEQSKGKSVREAFNSGKIDQIIDELVNRYAQVKYTDIWANFETLYNYIRNQIKEKADGVDRVSEAILNDISQNIALRLIQNNELDVSYYMSGSFNDIFVSNFDAYCERICEDCYKYVEGIIEKSGINLTCDKETYTYLLSSTVFSIIHDFNSKDILNGEYDEKIIKRFKFYLKRLTKNVQNYIYQVVNNMEFLAGIPVPEVVGYITKLVFSTKEISVQKLLEGKLDNFIEGCASKRRIVLDPSEAIKHIYGCISCRNTADMTQDELMEASSRICSMIYKNNDCSYEDIKSGKYDATVYNIFSTMSSRYLSVQHPKKENEIEYKPKKKRMSKGQFLLVILATLVAIGAGSLAYSIGSGLIDEIGESYNYFVNMEARNAVDDFDKFEYSVIYTTVAPDYKSTAMNVLDFYVKVADAGYDENFGHIGFYRAYNSVKDDRLQIMDDMLDLVQRKASSDSKYAGFYQSISYNTCYLDYVCNRLEQMGCEKISEEKYQNALSAYEHAMWKYPGEEPMKKISTKEQKVIYEIMDMYQKYSKECEADFGNALLDVKDSSIKYQSQNSGRKV